VWELQAYCHHTAGSLTATTLQNLLLPPHCRISYCHHTAGSLTATTLQDLLLPPHCRISYCHHTAGSLLPAYSRTPCQVTPHILWNPNVHYRINNSPSLGFILNKCSSKNRSEHFCLTSLLILTSNSCPRLSCGTFLSGIACSLSSRFQKPTWSSFMWYLPFRFSL